MTRTSFIGRPAVRAFAAAAAGAGLLAVAGGSAWAQGADFYDAGNPAVTVDMSVLDGGAATGAVPPSPNVGGGRSLLMPGAEAPVSRLLVRPQGRVAAVPPPDRSRPVSTAERAPEAPPAEPPKSTLQAAGPTAPAEAEPAAPAPRQTAEAPAPSQPPAPAPEAAAAPEPAPAATPTPAPARPQDLASAPPPPAVDKPQPPAAAPRPADTAMPAAPAAERPQIAAAPAQPVPQPPAVAAPVPPPPGPVAAAPAPAAPAAPEQAALPPADQPMKPGEAFKVLFEADEAKLSDGARNELKSLVQGIIDQPDLRIQLLAYAGGDSLSSSKARRLSLSRALAVRSYLIENGLRSTRIDVRALGNKTTEEPVNRVEVNVVER